MGKIIIKLTGNRPQIKFRGAITNEDIKESRRLLDCIFQSVKIGSLILSQNTARLIFR